MFGSLKCSLQRLPPVQSWQRGISTGMRNSSSHSELEVLTEGKQGEGVGRGERRKLELADFTLLWLALYMLSTAQRCSGRGWRQLDRLGKAFCPCQSLTTRFGVTDEKGQTALQTGPEWFGIPKLILGQPAFCFNCLEYFRYKQIDFILWMFWGIYIILSYKHIALNVIYLNFFKERSPLRMSTRKSWEINSLKICFFVCAVRNNHVVFFTHSFWRKKNCNQGWCGKLKH